MTKQNDHRIRQKFLLLIFLVPAMALARGESKKKPQAQDAEQSSGGGPLAGNLGLGFVSVISGLPGGTIGKTLDVHFFPSKALSIDGGVMQWSATKSEILRSVALAYYDFSIGPSYQIELFNIDTLSGFLGARMGYALMTSNPSSKYIGESDYSINTDASSANIAISVGAKYQPNAFYFGWESRTTLVFFNDKLDNVKSVLFMLLIGYRP